MNHILSSPKMWNWGGIYFKTQQKHEGNLIVKLPHTHLKKWGGGGHHAKFHPIALYTKIEQ